MDFEKWISGCLVRVFPWVDGKNIYVNVQYFRPGQSISRPPAWEKTVYIFDGFDYKLYAVPVNGRAKRMFYTSDFISLLNEHNGVFKKESGTSEIKHIKWQERVYKDAYICHEADILI